MIGRSALRRRGAPFSKGVFIVLARRRIVYESDHGGRFRIYVRNAG